MAIAYCSPDNWVGRPNPKYIELTNEPVHDHNKRYTTFDVLQFLG